MADYKTEQESFWAGEFGEEYRSRNKGDELVAANLALFSDVLKRTDSISSMIEFGSNIGLNLIALKKLLPDLEQAAIEINAESAKQLSELEDVKVYQQSIFDFKPESQRDFVLIKGVLIHINPDELNNVYDLLYQTSKKYVCVVEYYNPTPVALDYHGHSERLFKRDFAGELMDKYPDLKLVDYGFSYRRDPNFLFGDTTWFLLEKQK